MNPLFRLIRILRLKLHNGNLDSVDALLGCPVNMPKPEVIKNFESLGTLEQKLVCTSLFYCINWFRELINAFTYQNNQDLIPKVRGKSFVLIGCFLKKHVACVDY